MMKFSCIVVIYCMKKVYSIILTVLSFFFLTTNYCISQSIPEIISTLEIDTLLNHGPKDNRINLAIGNIKSVENSNPFPSKTDLISVITPVLEKFDPQDSDAKTGFSQYNKFFNVYSIWFPDPILYEPIPEYYQLTQGIRNELFLPWASENHGWITMFYTGGGGNGAGVVREQRVGDGTTSTDWETVLHEFNHTMPGLYDEYTASGEWSNYVCLDGPNVTSKIVIDEIPWRKWLEPDPIIPTPYSEEHFNQIGLFEGNISGYFGCYRPSAKSCYMGAGGFGEAFGQDMCSVCLQRFICMMYQYVNVIENPLPASSQIEINGNESIAFSADFIKPEPNTQKYEWFVNGILIEENVESIDVDFDACDQYEVKLVVTDTTEFVRYDEKFKDLYPEPKQVKIWNVNQSAVSSYNLNAQISATASDCKNVNNGSISIEPTGGLSPYQYSVNGKLTELPINGLAPGVYSVVIADSNGCSISEEIEITQDPILEFEICSSYLDNAWELSALIISADDQNLSYSWSNESTEPFITVNDVGSYSLTISNSNSCEVTREITLTEIESPLNVSYNVSNTLANKSTGAIYLSIYGGLEPYYVQWFQNDVVDQTSYLPNQVISSGNGEIDIHLPEFAFDDDISFGYDFWAERFTGSNFIGFDFEKSQTIEAYSITSNVDVKDRDGRSWILQGSDNGTEWTDIQTVNNFEFPERLQTFKFYLDEPATYQFFRLIFSENWGDSWIAIQQVEFGSFEAKLLPQHDDKRDLQSLDPGKYAFSIRDANGTCIDQDLNVSSFDNTSAIQPLEITKEGNYKVKISQPADGSSYFWSLNKDGSDLVHIGNDFQPSGPGQYYVRQYDDALSGFISDVKGFSITMSAPPQLQISTESISVLNPIENVEYYWYSNSIGGEPIHTGINFTPTDDGYYYVSARETKEYPEPINPTSIGGIFLHMDASDLDGDSNQDIALESSSAYDWTFTTGGKWDENGWFPYRSNYQNGLGIVDFATMWFQYVIVNPGQMKTLIMAYEESSFSFPNTAPLHGLNEYIPRHSDASQLFSNSAPASTLNGSTYLNGELVNPLTQPNPLEFIVLSVAFDNSVNFSPFASDEYWEGKLGELIVWDATLTDDQIKGVNEYLRKKWLSTADLESPRVRAAWGENILEDKDNDGYQEDVDCDDANALINPETLWYADKDSDGYGDASSFQIQCIQPTGYVLDSSDCDDDDAILNPLTVWYSDVDSDGYGDASSFLTQCSQPVGFVLDSNDCDDNNPSIYPGSIELLNNGIDENCDGIDLVMSLKNNPTNSILIYPNPALNMLNISSSEFILSIEIISITSQRARLFTYNNQLDVHLDISNYTNGFYLVKVVTLNQYYNQTIIIN